MLRKIIPLLLALVGLGGGVGAGLFLRPASEVARPAAGPEGKADGIAEEAAPNEGKPSEATPEYVKMNNQFVVPIVEEGRVSAMVVLSLSLEVEPGNTEAVYQREPKLRDAFLQVLFDHANIGGFSGSFTDVSNLVVLRTSLKEAASLVLGTVVVDVLITDIARQDS
ncbi:flagellar basal body-associated FliL family protein [Tabrizicola sp.]|jgi:flagellar protein FliL|uniref:flagellar basal body-associated FliL family protein n=1 Tax=Tabrizicola sp. TaxID=2005166 RepID=UPI0025E2AEE1|nr:flagellar basal body-associated FliL family protein [Tabrizicola sp.]MBY0350753.1 flagellar basal body-associated FliL family protein [Tabrizicola sp.]MDK2773854.1 flagellar basal body-associated FliL family protein [Tabrizicola sp.]